jgi:hypothetical protein
LQTQPTFVPPVKIPPRAPFGPSEVLNAGTPFEGMDLDLQKSAATKSETFVALEHEEKRQYRRSSPVPQERAMRRGDEP